MVFNVHLPEHDFTSRLCLENLGLIAADLVIANSDAVRRELLSRNLSIRRLEVVPNGVDLDAFCVSECDPEGDYVLFVGRLVAQKGIDVLLRAFAVLLREVPEAQLIITGDGGLELYLKRLMRYLGLHDNVSFIEWKSGSELVTLYQHAQVVVIPSYFEPFGIVALEAMACGRPVIASNVGGLGKL